MDIPNWIMTCAVASEVSRQGCSSRETHPTASCFGITPDMIIADNDGSRSEMDNVQMLVRKCSQVLHQWRGEAGGAGGKLGLDVGQVVVLAGPPEPATPAWSGIRLGMPPGEGESRAMQWTGQLSSAEAQPRSWQAEEAFLSRALPSTGAPLSPFLLQPADAESPQGRSPRPLGWEPAV